MGRSSSRDSSSSDSSRSSSRERRKREKRQRKERRRAEKQAKRDKHDKSRRRSPSPAAGKALKPAGSGNSKLQDATAIIESHLTARADSPPLPMYRPPAGGKAVTIPVLEPPTAVVVPQLIPPDSSEPDVPVEKLRIYVGNINYAATENDVRTAFSRFGVLRSVNMRLDPDKGHHRGFAFVEFMDAATVEMIYRLPSGAICFGGMPVRIDKPTMLGSGAAAAGGVVDVKPIPSHLLSIDIPVGPMPMPQARSALAQQIAASRGLVDMPAASAAAAGTARGPEATAIFIENMIRSPQDVDDMLVDEIRSECTKFGHVMAIEFYMAEGAAAPTVAVEFSSLEAAKSCSSRMNGRIFDGRPLRSGLLAREFFDRIKHQT